MVATRSGEKPQIPRKSRRALHAATRALRKKCERLSAQVRNRDLALFRQEKRILMLEHQKKVLLKHLQCTEASLAQFHHRVNLLRIAKKILRKWFTPQHPEDFCPTHRREWEIARMPPQKKLGLDILVTNIYRRNQKCSLTVFHGESDKEAT